MDKAVGVDPILLVDAVRIWTGSGGMAPNRNDARLSQQLGAKEASDILSVIKKLEEDFYATDACYTARDLQGMVKLAKERFALIHPSVPAEVGEVFAWCYTFDFR